MQHAEGKICVIRSSDHLQKDTLNLVIVSGLAYGIDIAAHKAALAFNLATVGVLANGLKTIYPSIHKSTAETMLEKRRTGD